MGGGETNGLREERCHVGGAEWGTPQTNYTLWVSALTLQRLLRRNFN